MHSGRDARGRLTDLPQVLRERQWVPGQSGNPSGKGGLYHEMQRLAREAAPAAVRRLIELAQLDRVDEKGNLLPLTSDADQRLVMLASSTLLERGFGKPKEYDPKSEQPERPKFDPSLYSDEELKTIRAALKIVMVRQNSVSSVAERGDGA